MIIISRGIFFTLLALLMIPVPVAAEPLIRTALLIGNSTYSDAPLLSPDTDIDKIAKALEKSQFNVTKETNLKRTEMLAAVSRFSQDVKESGGIAVLYYAGHAVQVKGINYLIPVDAEVNSEAEVPIQGINLMDVMQAMQAAGAMFNIVILEACYADPFGKKVVPTKPGLAEIKPPDDFLVMTACRPGQAIPAGKIHFSQFTDSLASFLSIPDEDMMDVAANVAEAVSESSKDKQIPWTSSSLKRPLSLYSPSRDFLNLLKDVKAYGETWKSEQNLKGVFTKWESLARTYPRWFAEIDSGDITDVVIRALSDDSKGIFYEMVQTFEIDLSLTNHMGIKFVYIPPGKFEMGSQFDEPGRGKDEQPYTVTIARGFFIQATELTQGQWLAVMGDNPSHFDDCGMDCPVENVSWNDVQGYISRLNMLEETESYRLPTEAEWEYAARAGSVTWFSFGNDVDNFGDYAWFRGNSGNTPHSVAQKKPNSWGLYDVHGNVWEWCQDWGGPYPKRPATNPSGPVTGDFRVARGGSWFYAMLQARSANRFYIYPDDRNYSVGFRLVLEPNL